MVQHALERREIAVGSTRNVAVSFAGPLSDALLTGTPTIVELDTTDLTLGNKTISTAELTISGETVVIAQAAQFTITGHLAATAQYTVQITTTTNASETLTLGVLFDVIAIRYAVERPEVVVGSTRTIPVSFAGLLDEGELLTGVPTVAELVSSDLGALTGAVNTSALTISGETAEIGQAVEFDVSGHLLDTGSYTILITATTDATPAQVLPLGVILDVVEVGG